MRIPAGDHQASDAFDKVGDRVYRRDEAEPVLFYEVPWQVDRRQEDRHEEQRERALDRLHRTRPYRQYGPYTPEPEGDEHREQHYHEHPADAAAYVHAHEQPNREEDDALKEAERHDAGEHSAQKCHGTHRGEREPVEEAALDV